MKNNKLLAIFLSVLLVSLAGCSQGDQADTYTSEVKTRCIGGVNYYLFTERRGYKGFGFMAVKYRKDGTVSLCD